jgi:NAD(P)-dependent dehydrogenase (short-subunit alcohol dehydrogenase family)
VPSSTSPQWARPVDVADGPVAAAEAALESFTRSWAAAFGANGIRFNTVAPGPTRTDSAVGTLGDRLEQLGSATPLGRTADPTEIAEAIVSWCRRGRATLPARLHLKDVRKDNRLG